MYAEIYQQGIVEYDDGQERYKELAVVTIMEWSVLPIFLRCHLMRLLLLLSSSFVHGSELAIDSVSLRILSYNAVFGVAHTSITPHGSQKSREVAKDCLAALCVRTPMQHAPPVDITKVDIATNTILANRH